MQRLMIWACLGLLGAANGLSAGTLYVNNHIGRPENDGRARESARRANCASNLSQIIKACSMYSDVPANLGLFPTGEDTALKSLNLLYDEYVADHRVFMCPSKPTDTYKLASAADGLAMNLAEGSHPTDGTNLTAFGYDERHAPTHAMAGVAGDLQGSGDGAGKGQRTAAGPAKRPQVTARDKVEVDQHRDAWKVILDHWKRAP